MLKLTDAQVADYFHRSYTAVDGLWFMKAESVLGFDGTLDIDAEVWKVMPKIQARKLKALGGVESGLDALFECLTTKLAIEKFEFTVQRAAESFEVTISICPWVELLAKSNRQHLAECVGRRICDLEYGVWASEFGPGISMTIGERICQGCKGCHIRFSAEK